MHYNIVEASTNLRIHSIARTMLANRTHVFVSHQNHARAAAGPSVDRSRGFVLACDKRKGSRAPRTPYGIRSRDSAIIAGSGDSKDSSDVSRLKIEDPA